MGTELMPSELDLRNAIKRVENLGSNVHNRRASIREIRDTWEMVLGTNFQYIPNEVIQGLIGDDKQFQDIQQFGYAVKKDFFREAAIDRIFMKQNKPQIDSRFGKIKFDEHNQRLMEIVELVQAFVDMTMERMEENKELIEQ